MKFFAFLAFFWNLLCTSFICFFCLLEGPLTLSSKPLWTIGIMLLLGGITGMVCMESLMPPVKKKRRKVSKRNDKR